MSSRIRTSDEGPGARAAAPDPPEPTPSEPTKPLPVADPPPAPEPEPREPEPGDLDQPPAGEAPDKAELRIRQLTREKYEAERRAREAEQRWMQMQQPQRPVPQPGQSPADAAAEERAFQRFQAQQTDLAFAAKCNTLWDEGVREYGGDQMTEAKRALDAVGWGNDAYALQSLTDLPDGHRVYRALAADLDNAARILRLPHDKRTIELAWLSGRGRSNGAPSREAEPEPLPVSRAPEPIRPIGARSSPRELRLDDPNLSMAEYIRRRDREERRSRISR